MMILIIFLSTLFKELWSVYLVNLNILIGQALPTSFCVDFQVVGVSRLRVVRSTPIKIS